MTEAVFECMNEKCRSNLIQYSIMIQARGEESNVWGVPAGKNTPNFCPYCGEDIFKNLKDDYES